MISEKSAHLCADYGAYGYDYGFFEYVRISQTQFADILSIPECYNNTILFIEENHDKVQRTYILLTCFYRAYEATDLHRPARQRHVINQNKNADWSTAWLASGFPLGNRSRSDRAQRVTAQVSRRNR